MKKIKFRLAKPSDAKQIAYCHWHVRDRYTTGIFLSLGESFLRAYYKIILDDPYEVVICAENGDGKIVGFSSATQDAEKQAQNLKKHKIRLGFAALSAFICKPSLIKEVWLRYRSLDHDDVPKYVDTKGVRGEYWCWLKDVDSNVLSSFQLDDIKNRVLFELGEKELFGEVDKTNEGVLNFHLRAHKAEIIDEFTLPDGRERVVIKIPLFPGRMPKMNK